MRPAESPVLFTATLIAVTLLSSLGRSQATNSDQVTKKLIALTQRQVEVSEQLVVFRKAAWAYAREMQAAGGREGSRFAALDEIAWLDARLVILGYRKTLHELQLRLNEATAGTRKSLLEVVKKRVSVAREAVAVARRHHENMQDLRGSGRVGSRVVHNAQQELFDRTLGELSLRKEVIVVEARLAGK